MNKTKPRYIRRIEPDWRSFWLLTGAAIAAILLGYFLQMCGFVSASNITQATWGGKIEVRNLDSPALSNVTTNFTLNTTDLITRFYVNASVNNSAIRGVSGTDLTYMPGQNSTSPWMLIVPSLASYEIQKEPIYTGGAQSMASKIRYFPGQAGMTTPDVPGLEPSSNFTYEVAGFVDMSTSDNIVNKNGALNIKTHSSTANITATATYTAAGSFSQTLTVNGAGFYTNMPSVQGAATHWQAAQSNDGITSTVYSREYDISTYTDTFAMTDGTFTSAYLIDSVVINISTSSNNTAIAEAWCKSVVRLGTDNITSGQHAMTAGWTTFSDSLARPGGGSWLWSDIDDLQAGVMVFGTAASGWQHCSYVTVTVNYHYYVPTSSALTVTGQTSGEKTIRTGIPSWQTGNVLHFDGTANSNINTGAVYNAATQLWISLRFKLDTPFASGFGHDMCLFGKQLGGNDFIDLILTDLDGRLVFRKYDGGPTFGVTSTQTSWAANTWYHVLFSISSVNAVRLRIDNGTAITNANTSAVCNGGNFVIGNRTLASTNGFTGTIFNVTVGTDDLTLAEENALYTGTAPPDATDYWTIDEGAGNSITSYGSSANTGTKGADATWTTSTYTSGQTGRLYEFGMQVNTSTAFVRYIYGASIAPTANNWVTSENYTMPYIEYQRISVNGTAQQYVSWQLSPTFTDATGHGNNATPSFRSTGTTNVTAALVDYAPVHPPAASPSTWGGAGSMVAGAPTMPPQMFTELAITLPLADAVNVLLDWAAVPRAFFWFPVCMFQVVALGFLAYWISRKTPIAQLVTQAIAIAGFALAGVWTFWMVPIYVFMAVTVITVKRLMGAG